MWSITESHAPSGRILVDADACPVRREAEEVAARFGVAVRMFANPSSSPASGFAARVTVAEGRDAADFAIFLECREADVVVTDDIGLAAMVLSRGALALSSRGKRYLKETIGGELHGRHLAKKARRAGKRTRGPRPFTGADRFRFAEALAGAVSEAVSRMNRKDGMNGKNEGASGHEH